MLTCCPHHYIIAICVNKPSSGRSGVDLLLLSQAKDVFATEVSEVCRTSSGFSTRVAGRSHSGLVSTMRYKTDAEQWTAACWLGRLDLPWLRRCLCQGWLDHMWSHHSLRKGYLLSHDAMSRDMDSCDTSWPCHYDRRQSALISFDMSCSILLPSARATP